MRDLLAKRYAKALFSIGEDDGQAEAYGQAIANFAEGLERVGPEGSALYSPAFPKNARAEALEAILAKIDPPKVVGDFIRLLGERGKLGFIYAISASYQKLLDEKEGLIRGVLTVAAPLDEGRLSAIRAALGTFAGKRVELTVKEDPAIIGGVVAKLGDLVVDGSLRTRFDRLSRLLGSA
jgi:F-type H+-transporting ATPase subunit delta